MAGNNSGVSFMNNNHHALTNGNSIGNNNNRSFSFLTLDNELSGPGLLRIGKYKFRAKTDDLPQYVSLLYLLDLILYTDSFSNRDWWVASTAFPLIAATIGPLANVLSISALVTKWRADLPDNGQLPLGSDENGVGIPDPTWWEIYLCPCS